MQKVKMLYLTSLYNSGSTIVALLANSHPDICSPGELYGPGGAHHDERGPMCSCGEYIVDCRFWKEIGRQMRSRGQWWRPDYWGMMYDRGYNTPLLSRILFGRPSPKLVRDRFYKFIPFLSGKVREFRIRNLSMAQSVTEVSGKSCIFNTAKSPELMVRLAYIKGIDLRVIHLVRDPRGWCCSRMKRGEKNIERTMQRWVTRNSYIGRLTEIIPPDRRLFFRYEQFCENPQAIMDLIYELADLRPSPIPEDISTIHGHFIGNRMRTRGDKAIKEDLTWQTKLSEREIATIMNIAKPLANELGYSF